MPPLFFAIRDWLPKFLRNFIPAAVDEHRVLENNCVMVNPVTISIEECKLPYSWDQSDCTNKDFFWQSRSKNEKILNSEILHYPDQSYQFNVLFCLRSCYLIHLGVFIHFRIFSAAKKRYFIFRDAATHDWKNVIWPCNATTEHETWKQREKPNFNFISKTSGQNIHLPAPPNWM